MVDEGDDEGGDEDDEEAKDDDDDDADDFSSTVSRLLFALIIRTSSLSFLLNSASFETNGDDEGVSVIGDGVRGAISVGSPNECGDDDDDDDDFVGVKPFISAHRVDNCVAITGHLCMCKYVSEL